MPNPTTCPACKAEIHPDVAHNKCPGSQRVTREELDALTAAIRKLDNRVESHSMSIMYLTQAVKGSGENISNAFVEIHKLADHHDALGHQHIELEIERLKDQLRTIGRAVIDSPTGIVCRKMDAIVRPVPEVEDDETGGGLDRNATPREGRCPTPAASALPMPERPHSIGDTDDSGEPIEVPRQWLRSLEQYALALEARLAEAVAVAGDAIGTDPTQRSTGCVDALAGHYRIVRADRDALRAKLDGVRQVMLDEEALARSLIAVNTAARQASALPFMFEPTWVLEAFRRITSALAAAENTNTGAERDAASKEASDDAR